MTGHTGYLQIQLRTDEDKEAWNQAAQEVAEVLETSTDELTRPEIVRELTEAYTGRDALGRWKHES